MKHLFRSLAGISIATVMFLLFFNPRHLIVRAQSCGGGGGGNPPCSCPSGESCYTNGCVPSSPILVDVRGNGFAMTSVQDGVYFDLGFSSYKEKTAWTEAGSDDAWLALDRNGDGQITDGTELFGDVTAQEPSNDPNGFRALAEFDKRENGGNGDGIIDKHDAVFSRLLLWQDLNHDGLSQPNELHHLADLGITSIDLRFHTTRRVDQYGNHFRYAAEVGSDDGAGHLAYDVFPVSNPPSSPPIPKDYQP